VLKFDQGRSQGRSLFCHSDQGDDRIRAILRYLTVALLLGFKRNAVERIFLIKGWQVRKRPVGMLSRIQAEPSVAMAPSERSLNMKTPVEAFALAA
jgi:hypothetical protein